MADYEAERQARIAENKRRMSEIGLAQVRPLTRPRSCKRISDALTHPAVDRCVNGQYWVPHSVQSDNTHLIKPSAVAP